MLINIDDISNNDAIVKDINIGEKSLKVYVKTWNNFEKVLYFDEYYAIKEKMSVGAGIGDIIFSEDTPLLNEIKNDMVRGGQKECGNLVSCIIKDDWNERVILEICVDRKLLNDIFLNI